MADSDALNRIPSAIDGTEAVTPAEKLDALRGEVAQLQERVTSIEADVAYIRAVAEALAATMEQLQSHPMLGRMIGGGSGGE